MASFVEDCLTVAKGGSRGIRTFAGYSTYDVSNRYYVSNVYLKTRTVREASDQLM
jgi:hypothetical protein